MFVARNVWELKQQRKDDNATIWHDANKKKSEYCIQYEKQNLNIA